MYITMCLYITITILLWVLSIYPFIKHYTIVVSIITIQFSHMVDILPNGMTYICYGWHIAQWHDLRLLWLLTYFPME